MEKAYRNLGYFFILLIPLTVLAFSKTYFNQIPDFEGITINIHLHALIASLWILMLIVQPLLIRNKKNDLHKKVGRISYFIFPLLILSFIPQMLRIINSDNPKILFFPLSDCLLLILFYLLAIYHKRSISKHMRFMIGTALVFLGPTLGRIGTIILGLSEIVSQNSLYAIIYLILIGLIMLDRKHHKKFQPYLLILVAWVMHQLTFNLIF